MLSDDYLVRRIIQFAAVMARIIGLKMAGEYEKAIREIETAQEQLFGMNIELIKLLDGESLYRHPAMSEDPDYDKLRYIADLLKEEGDILNLQNKKADSDDCYARALDYYLHIESNKLTSTSGELPGIIDELFEKLGKYTHTNRLLLDLFCHFENEGKFEKADKILFELSHRPDENMDIKTEAELFYERLLKKSEKELTMGGISRQYVKDKLRGYQ